jgi:hypothetical protein
LRFRIAAYVDADKQCAWFDADNLAGPANHTASIKKKSAYVRHMWTLVGGLTQGSSRKRQLLSLKADQTMLGSVSLVADRHDGTVVTLW